MATVYDYVLAVWLRLDVSCATPGLALELREYLDAEYQIIKLEVVEEPESDAKGEVTVSLQLQTVFDESQMEGYYPTDKATGDLDREFRAYLESKYAVNYLEIMEEAGTSYLLAERGESE